MSSSSWRRVVSGGIAAALVAVSTLTGHAGQVQDDAKDHALASQQVLDRAAPVSDWRADRDRR